MQPYAVYLNEIATQMHSVVIDCVFSISTDFVDSRVFVIRIIFLAYPQLYNREEHGYIWAYWSVP